MAQAGASVRDPNRRDTNAEIRYEAWHHWPINWSAIVVGALAALAVVGLLGLIAIALGSRWLEPTNRVVDLKTIRIEVMAFSVCGAFFAFVIGGWAAGKVAGILHSEQSMLHGAIVWLVALPALLILTAMGAGGYSGGWYAGLAGTSPQVARATANERPDIRIASATPKDQLGNMTEEQRTAANEWDEDTARATRNAALLTLTALLLGLMGSVVGGWMASGEPMTLTHRRPQPAAARL